MERQLKYPLTEDHATFKAMEPYPFLVCDDMMPKDLCKQAVKEALAIPKESWIVGTNKIDPDAPPKFSIPQLATVGPACAELHHLMHNEHTIEWLRYLTGINDLVGDTDFMAGAGLHQTPQGGYLGMHVDFNQHPRTGLYRRVNSFVFLNEETLSGGDLILSPSVGATLPADGCVWIKPKLGRYAMFEYGEHAWHGHPMPYRGERRLSIAAYYYSAQTPSDFTEKHSTIYTETT